METKEAIRSKHRFPEKIQGIVQLQKHFEQNKEKMKSNPARSVLENTIELAINLFVFLSEEHSSNYDIGLFSLLPDAQVEDYEEE